MLKASPSPWEGLAGAESPSGRLSGAAFSLANGEHFLLSGGLRQL